MTNQSPLYVGPDDLLRTLRGAGGQTFTDFADSLIRADMSRAGVRLDQVVTNIRTSIPDGGVDTRIKVAAPGVLALEAPSAWQYKATDYGKISEPELVKEMRKPVSSERLSAGDLYCLCICDDAPAEWQEGRQAEMLEEARAQNPGAPVPRLLCAGQLADWANRFPSVVVRFFRPQLELVLHHEAWLRNQRAELTTYVPIAGRVEAAGLIADYIDFGRPVRGLLTISGAMGTGKSRFVAETLASASALVLYVPNEANALNVATYLVNNASASAILVVDACTNATRLRLETLLRGSEQRLRFVVIRDSSEQSSDVDIELVALEDAELQSILNANFPDLPSAHRNALAHLSDGVPQIAARLVAAYLRDRERFLVNSDAWCADTLQSLVRDHADVIALQLVSLFPRLGYHGTVAEQLSTVSRVFGVDGADVLIRCRRLARAPGIVAIGPRYLSVRPRLLAGALLQAAWTRWLRDDAASILAQLPPTLRLGLIRQVAMHGSAVERDSVVEWARPWLRTLTANDLVVANSVELLVALLEVNPARLAGPVTDLIRSAPPAILQASGEATRYTSTRAHLLRAFRELVGRRETYQLAEDALYRFAQLEGAPEDAVANEATAVAKWAASFRIYLSGCETPFDARLEQLRRRFEEGAHRIPLVLAALRLILSGHASRTEGRPLHSRRLRPEEWTPATWGIFRECLRGAILLLGRCLVSTEHRAAALRVIFRNGRTLLQSGTVASLREILKDVPLDDEERVGVLAFARDYMRYDSKKEPENATDKFRRTAAAYATEVAAWIAQLEHTDVSSRLVELVGATHWFDDAPELMSQIREVATALNSNRVLLGARLAWLTNTNGNGTALLELGTTLGRLDEAGELLPLIFDAAAHATNPLFVRGYVIGFAEIPEHNDAIRRALDDLEARAPMMAADLNRMARAAGAPEERALRLVRERRLSANQLPFLLTRPTPEFLADTIDVALEFGDPTDGQAAAIGLDLVGHLAWLDTTVMPEDERSLEALWRLMAAAIPGVRTETQAWGRLLQRLSQHELRRAIEVSVQAIRGGDFSIQQEAIATLTAFMSRDAGLCLSIYGPMLLAEDQGPYRVGRRARALRALPTEMLRPWIEANGVAAARVIAPNLSTPTINGDGSTFVDPLTEFVLERYEDDEDVFDLFVQQRHDGSHLYAGDIAGQHDAEVRQAAAFLTHRLRRIRQWAEDEMVSAQSDARFWREHHEERFEE